jgi:hypothetical protein
VAVPLARPLGLFRGAQSMDVKRLLGLAHDFMVLMILVSKFILIIMKIVGEATNYSARLQC